MAAEVKEACASGCPRSDRPGTGWEGPARRVAGLSSPGQLVPLPRGPSGSLRSPTRPPAPLGSPGLEGEGRLLWTGQHDRCLSRDRGAGLEGTHRPHILPPPSTFPKQPGLGWAWLTGVAGAQEPGMGRGKAWPRGQQCEVSR